jgi:COP9 signalosome complex subunit 2
MTRCDSHPAAKPGVLSDAQGYDFEYTDGEDGDEGASADAENMYYTAKSTSCPLSTLFLKSEHSNTAKKEDNPEAALKDFRAIVAQEKEKGDWCVSNAFSDAN